jgi:hypothetical protein
MPLHRSEQTLTVDDHRIETKFLVEREDLEMHPASDHALIAWRSEADPDVQRAGRINDTISVRDAPRQAARRCRNIIDYPNDGGIVGHRVFSNQNIGACSG